MDGICREGIHIVREEILNDHDEPVPGVGQKVTIAVYQNDQLASRRGRSDLLSLTREEHIDLSRQT
jgi:hypothetical protein